LKPTNAKIAYHPSNKSPIYLTLLIALCTANYRQTVVTVSKYLSVYIIFSLTIAEQNPTNLMRVWFNSLTSSAEIVYFDFNPLVNTYIHKAGT